MQNSKSELKCHSLLYPHDGDLLLHFNGESLLSSLLFKMTIFLGAVVDCKFLTDTAEELLKRQEVLKVPVLMGITNHEFGWILPQVSNLILMFYIPNI